MKSSQELASPKSLEELNLDPSNPRSITEKALAALKESLEYFGDLSGIIYNSRTGQLVGANQRITVFKSYGKDIELTYRPDGSAYIKHPATGEHFNVRIVSWDMEMQVTANVAANNQAYCGVFTDGVRNYLEIAKKTLSTERYAKLEMDEVLLHIEKKSLDGDGDGDGGKNGKGDKVPEPVDDPVIQSGDMISLGRWVYCPKCNKKHPVK